MDRNSKFSLNSTLLYNLSTHCGHHQFSTFVHKPDQQKGAATMTRSMHILQASQLKTSSLTADFPPSFTSRSIYKFINLHLPRLVKEKKKKGVIKAFWPRFTSPTYQYLRYLCWGRTACCALPTQ